MKKAPFSDFKIRKIDVEGYEEVVEFIEEKSGLHALIALHNTKMGPALGGTRVYPYRSVDEALEDVKRLSEGMTYKAAVSQTGTGGGKSVIIADNRLPKSEELLAAFAEAVNSFSGKYICAEDVGMSLEDLGVVGRYTPYAVGLPHPKSSGDPSPFTTWGVFRGIEAVAYTLWGSNSLQGKRVAIQGLGAVGMKLARMLFWAGAKLYVSDIDSERCQSAQKEFSATIVSSEEIMNIECDIFAPCAMGGILTPETIAHLRCKAVAGAANNQLLTPACGQLLKKRAILYAPDYVINSGGLMNVCVELRKEGYDPNAARQQVDQIYSSLLEIFAHAEKKGCSTHEIAHERAEANLMKGIGARKEDPCFATTKN